jgi:hypothetical protein
VQPKNDSIQEKCTANNVVLASAALEFARSHSELCHREVAWRMWAELSLSPLSHVSAFTLLGHLALGRQ